MNIYALKGFKVKLVSLTAGYGHDQDTVKEFLELNKEYTIEDTNVDSWNTDVYLQEVPGIRFNSVFFEDVSEQSEEENKQHPDYKKFH